MNIEDRLKKAHIALSRDDIWCSYAVLLACGDTVVSRDRGPTACTDGWTKWYNPDFIAKLDDAELNLLVLHENTHVAFQHLKVWAHLYDEDARLANIAMDHYVNLALIDSDKGRGVIKMPKDGVQPDPRFRGMNVQQIYDILKQEQKDKGEGEGEGEGEEGFDSHDWDGAKKQQQKVEDQEQRAKEIENAIRQGEAVRRTRGRGKGGANGVFGDLLAGKTDWRKLLREFVQTYCTDKQESSWRKPNRRYLADDIYMPSLVGKKIDSLVIGFDTSGSCFGTSEMTQFVSELSSLVGQVKPGTLHVVYCDYDVQGHQTFKDGQFAVHALKPRGGGGTNLTNIFKFVEEKRIKPSASVILTDGYTPFGNATSYPTLWAINTSVKAPWGVTVHLK